MIIQETRWKCDYCGVVSPVIDEGQEAPNGWHQLFYSGGYMVFDRNQERVPNFQYCCQDHAIKDKERRNIELDKFTARTEEIIKKWLF